ncbi:DUF3006 domain-containing protein [Tindallia californiensis]|uniref:DUF3006 domain-containing protein n=1 Tax=Tindallia californiensis TaxID=159292 RepID=A0A1H3NVQ9_9FIRM|nr:DUF3006 domain-containing protein [Tindallia californiensis]SDY92938.1 Protein of unknown function [Tindallia californiensis]
MKMIIDRLEGDYAVVELDDGTFADIPKEALPKLANEGDVITIEIDEKATEQRKKRIERLLNELWEESDTE